MKPFSMPIREKCQLRNPTAQDEIPFSLRLSFRFTSSFEPRTSYVASLRTSSSRSFCTLHFALSTQTRSVHAVHTPFTLFTLFFKGAGGSSSYSYSYSYSYSAVRLNFDSLSFSKPL